MDSQRSNSELNNLGNLSSYQQSFTQKLEKGDIDKSPKLINTLKIQKS